jgi:magnesium transporter
VPVTHWKVALHDRAGLLWVDFSDEPKEKVEKYLTDVFSFHPLAIDDALKQAHVPKVDDWGEYVYVVVHGLTFIPEKYELETHEIDGFLGKNFLVTYHKNALASADHVWTAAQRDPRYLARGADYLLYNIFDMLASDLMPVVDQLDDAIDQLEDEVFNSSGRIVLTKLFAIKRAILHLRRIIIPQREVMNRLARDTYAVIDSTERIYFRDVYDHFVRLADINDTLRDLISGTLDTYLSVSANRTNEIMKVLTIFTAMFMPLTFFTGFFGMNFETLPFNNSLFFLSMMGIMILMPFMLWLWFKRRGWIE